MSGNARSRGRSTVDQLPAYVEAPATPTAENPPPSWFAAHELLLWNAPIGASRPPAAAASAIVPGWSGDGTRLLYVANDGLWLLPLATVEIEHPLFPTDALSAISS